MRRISIQVEPDVPGGLRIDKYLADVNGLCTRSQLKISLREILQNGRPVKASKTVQPGACLEISLEEAEAPSYRAEAIPLDIVYEDARVIVVNKAAGMVVHPGAGVGSGTLVQALLAHAGEIGRNFPGEVLRPGIVHRIDKDTSGLIIAAKDPAALEFLARQFRARAVKKIYFAILQGNAPRESGVVTGYIRRDPRQRKRFCLAAEGGKYSETLYSVLSARDGLSLVRLKPKTGRTHQLRVHMKSLGCPILGDPLYGGRGLPPTRLMLHAASLSLTLPGGDSPRTFRAPPPAEFIDMLGRQFKIP